MPGIEDWTTRPYSVIQKIFDENKGNSHEVFVKQVQSYFSSRITADSLLKIPSLNCVNTDHLPTGYLVRYRCMIQDVYDPQFCFAQYSVKNNNTDSTRIECGTFKDISNIAPDETIDLESRENVPVERQGFYCVPIPGESTWVKEIFSKTSRKMSTPFSQSNTNLKRSRDREESDSFFDQKAPRGIADSSRNESEKVEAPDHVNLQEDPRPVPDGSKINMPNLDMNHPLPDENGIPCIVRVYSNDVELKTSDCVEFIGILSLDPELASIHDNENVNERLDHEELSAHEPPASLVPRIHAILAQPLDHSNPTLPLSIASDEYKAGVDAMMKDVCSLRMEILAILQHALLGDRLAAEYLLSNLLSRIYGRADVLPLGKLSLNLSGCPNFQRYAKFLHHLISQLTTKSTLFEMSIENLNSWKLIPKKDYNTNRVVAGMLQLSPGTHLVLDETALQQGQLNNTGVLNVRALEDVLTWQKVDYDFQWSAVPIHTDISVLVLSEGPSFLTKDFQVPMQSDNDIADIPAHFAKLDARLTEDNLNKLRSYLTACRLSDYEVSGDLQKLMEEDFVQTRQTDPNEMSVEDFKRLLTLVRHLTTSYGIKSPTQEIWMKAKSLENERKARISRLPQPSNGMQ